MLPGERFAWSNEDGTLSKTFTDFKCPPGFVWVTGWTFMVDPSGATTDSDGWSYSTQFTKSYQGANEQKSEHRVRRRKWQRRRAPMRNPVNRASNLTVSSSSSAFISANNLTVGSGARGGGAPMANNARNLSASQSASSLTMSAARANVQQAVVSLSSLYLGSPVPTNEPLPTPPVTKKVFAIECQRYFPIKGWLSTFLPTDSVTAWSDATGKPIAGKEVIKLKNKRSSMKARLSLTEGKMNPAIAAELFSSSSNQTDGVQEREEIFGEWRWSKDWQIDIKPTTDKEGWSYSVDFHNARWHSTKSIEHFARKRFWIREKTFVVDHSQMRKAEVKQALELIGRWRAQAAAEAKDSSLIPAMSAFAPEPTVSAREHRASHSLKNTSTPQRERVFV